MGAAGTGLRGAIREPDRGREAAGSRVAGFSNGRRSPADPRASSGSLPSRGEPDDRRAPAEVHQPEQDFLSEGRLSQAGPAELLRRGGAADSASPQRPAAVAEALSERHRQAVLLSEGSGSELPQVAPH